MYRLSLSLLCLVLLLPVFTADQPVNSEKNAIAVVKAFVAQVGWTADAGNVVFTTSSQNWPKH